jgi:hypothetical protein
MRNATRKTLLWVIAAAALIAAMFAADGFIPDAGGEIKSPEFWAAYYGARKLGAAIVQYREQFGSNPPTLAELEKKGFFRFAGGLNADSIEYFPEITPDHPPMVPLFWTKKAFLNADSSGHQDGNYIYFIGFANGMFGNWPKKDFENSRDYCLQFMALLKSDAAKAERFIANVLDGNAWRNALPAVECACYRLGELKSGRAALIKALDFQPAAGGEGGYASIRFEAARALALMGDPAGARILKQGLLSERYNERMRSLYALKILGEVPAGYDPLMDKASREAAVGMKKP